MQLEHLPSRKRLAPSTRRKSMNPLGRGLALTLVATALGTPVMAQTPPSPSVQPAPSVILAPLADRPRPLPAPVFETPPAIRDEPEADWRAANDEAARLGGHVGQMRGRR